MPDLEIGLTDPGLTPMLRAGLGGLAASLRSILLAKDPSALWPTSVPLGPGSAVVNPGRVAMCWAGDPSRVLKALFESSFRVTKKGLIDLVGTRDAQQPLDPPLAAVRQAALKRTFLQHGKTTVKTGKLSTASVLIDDQQRVFAFQPYSAYVHQQAWERVAAALPGGHVELAGWAYPGAAQRHIKFRETKWLYTPAQALCAAFSIVGCVSYLAPHTSGALVIVEPNDLVRFAVSRPRMGPLTVPDAYVSGVGDAVLAVQLALRMEDLVANWRGGVAATHGVLLRTLPWARQQKTRSDTISLREVPEERLALYDQIRRTLRPTVISAARESDEEREDAGAAFVATSVLRGFLTDNIAKDRAWHRDFAGATTGGKKPRFIHYYRDRDAGGLGALYPQEREGLIAMLEHLDDAERALVRSVHVALRQRFGAIADESRDSPQAMKNRFGAERDKWRLAFAGSKTPDQIRAALADLWSRAGSNDELRERWELVLPLLRGQWRAARDLALVALASYKSQSEPEGERPKD